MRNVVTTVYQYTELSDAAKEKAREWYRHCQYENCYWSESVIEDAAGIAGMMGIDLRQRPVKLYGGGTRYEPAIYWSGFWNQGDGACFEGTWRASDVELGAVGKHVGDSEQCLEVKRIAAEFERLAKEFPEASFSVKHCGHCQHENCTEFDFTLDGGDELTEAQSARVDDAEEELKEAARDFMRWIYRQLEKEYEYQNADEQVVESIIANQYEFKKDGSRA